MSSFLPFENMIFLKLFSQCLCLGYMINGSRLKQRQKFGPKRKKYSPYCFFKVIFLQVEAGLPCFQLPWHFGLNSTHSTTAANSTANSTADATADSSLSPLEIVQELGMGIVMMPLVSILQHLAIAKHYAGSLQSGGGSHCSARTKICPFPEIINSEKLSILLARTYSQKNLVLHVNGSAIDPESKSGIRKGNRKN